jgi:hypothetical protein
MRRNDISIERWLDLAGLTINQPGVPVPPLAAERRRP